METITHSIPLIGGMEYIKVSYTKYWEFAQVPTRQTPFSVGSDLYSAFDYCIPKGEMRVIDTGIGVIIPLGYYGRLAPRSGLTYKHFLDVKAGVIDPDYMGPVCVILFNHGDQDYPITRGDSVAQIIYEKVGIPIYEETKTIPRTERGNKGFGSLDLAQQSLEQAPDTAGTKHVTFNLM